MKKVLFVGLILTALISTKVNAQSGPQGHDAPDPAVMLQQMKEKIKPQMVEKTGLTDAQADRVIEINFETRQAMMTGFKDLNDEDRSKKMAEFKAVKERKYAAIPLTAEQIKAVYAFYENMGKNWTPKSGS